jgi:branched-chain amino acid transport system ATP-binding protein
MDAVTTSPNGSRTLARGGALSATGLVAGYGGAPVLKGIDLEVPAGSITAVLGANGAGKTTLLRTLSGLVKPSAGEVVFDGVPLAGVKVEQYVRRGIAHVPEGRGVVTELTVDENLRLGGLWRSDRVDAAAAKEEVYQLFEPLARRRNNEGNQLSGGERQMLAIGRALVARPRLLLLDEPSLGLAPKVTAQIMALLAHLRDHTGLTVLLVEQNVRSALSIADTGVVMSLGQVVTATDAATLRGDEKLRHAYLGF